MREIILKKDVLQMVQEERQKLKNDDELSADEKQVCDEFLFRIYHKVQIMGMNRGK